MKKYITFVAFAVLIGSCTPHSGALAQECAVEILSKRFPSAVSAIGIWSKRNSVAINAETQHLLLNDFCQAANAIQVKTHVGDATLNEVASEVIIEYLDSENDSFSTSVSSIGAILRSALGASGLAPRKPKRLATLELEYTHHNIDYLQINNDQMPPYKRIMHIPGRFLLKGMKGTLVVCSVQIELVVNQITKVTC